MLNELALWWLRQMRDLLPRSWRDAAARPGAALVIECASTTLPATAVCWRRTRRRRTEAGTLILDDSAASAPGVRRRKRMPVMLRLPVEPLRCEVILPLPAEHALERVLNAELDRLTPFDPRELYWSARVTQRDPAGGTLRAILSLVPRATLAPVLAALQTRGLSPEMLETVQPDGGLHHIALDSPVRARRLVPLMAAAAMVVVLVAALATPFLLQQQEEAALARRMAELKPAVDRVQALRSRVVTPAVNPTAVLAERRRVGDAVQVLATLTDLLPDDTFLATLALNQRRLTVSGQSAGAAGLIELLSRSAVIRNPAFVAPVTRDAAAGADVFSLNAEVAP